jgi:hypothetical protein
MSLHQLTVPVVENWMTKLPVQIMQIIHELTAKAACRSIKSWHFWVLSRVVNSSKYFSYPMSFSFYCTVPRSFPCVYTPLTPAIFRWFDVYRGYMHLLPAFLFVLHIELYNMARKITMYDHCTGIKSQKWVTSGCIATINEEGLIKN